MVLYIISVRIAIGWGIADTDRKMRPVARTSNFHDARSKDVMAGLADEATKNGDWGSHKENDNHKGNDELGMI